MRIVSIDTESPYSDEVSVKPLGYWKYARHPWVDEYIISVCDGKEAWAGEARDFNFDSLAGATLLMHNAAHDEEILLAGAERGFFQIPGLKQFGNTHIHCTANMSSYLWNMRSLADACRVGLGVSVSKDVRNRAKGKKWADIKREGWWDSFIQYAREDAQLPWFLWDKHNSKWPEFERRLSRLTIDQGRRGVRIDIEALDRGIALLHRVIHTAQQNLPWVARGKAPASPIGIAEECRTVGIPPPPVKAHDPEAAEKWEAEHAPQHKFVLALRNLRKAKKTLATLETIKLRIRPDETVAFSLKYAGTHTLRWAGDAGWNLQNMNREPLFIDPEFSFVFDRQRIKELVTEFEQQDAAAGALPSGTSFFDMRGLIIARPGMKLAPVDLAQIEPRVLNHTAGNTSLLDRVRTGMAIYEAFAREALGWAGGKLKDEDKKLYALSKADVLGLGYRAGWEKFITVAQMMAGLDITEGDEEFARKASIDGRMYVRARDEKNEWEYDGAPDGVLVKLGDPLAIRLTGERCVFVKKLRWKDGKQVEAVAALPVRGMRSRITVQEFRANNPKVVALWEAFDEALADAASRNEDLVVKGPHGGQMTYRRVRREARMQVNSDTGEKYLSRVFTAEIAGKRYVLHGGVLTENYMQWVSRYVFAERMLDLHDQLQAENPEQWVLFSVHDEAVPELFVTDSEATRKRIEAVFSITPDWLAGCPIAAECKVTPRYLK